MAFCGTTFSMLAGALVLTGNVAFADSRVLIAGTEAIDLQLDDESRATIEEALQTAATTVEEWNLVSTPVSTSMLRRDGGCGALDESCLERIAERRGLDRILLTSVRPSSTDEETVELSVRLFDRYTRTIRGTYEATLDADDLDSSRELGRIASELMAVVGSLPEEGAAVIRAVAGAEVFVDGQSVGVVPASGELTLTPIPVGRREVRVVRPSRAVWESPVIVRPRESVAVIVDVGTAVASFDPHASSERRGAQVLSATEPPPSWVLTVPGVVIAAHEPVVGQVDQVTRVPFRVPAIQDHLQRGEFRTTQDARLGFMPNVSSSGARVTAKLHF